MSGAAEALSSFDFSSLTEFAADLGSVVTDFGTEFMSSIDLTSFEIPSFEVPSFGGFGEVGSFAGSGSWFDTFNPGAILDSIPNISDFNLSSLTDSLPSLSSIKDTFSTFSKDLGGFVQTGQKVVNAYQKVAPVVNVAANALGIQNPLTPIAQAAQQALGVAGSAAGFAKSAASGLESAGKLQEKATSFFASDPNAPEKPSLFEQAKNSVSNLFTTDPNSTNARDVATGLPINTPREISDDPFEQARLDAEQEANKPGPTQAAVAEQLGFVDRVSLAADTFASDFKGLVTEYPGIAKVASQATGLPIATAFTATDPYGLTILGAAETAALTRNINPAFLNSFTDPGVPRAVDEATGLPINTPRPVTLPAGVTSQFTTAYDPETGQWSVFDNISGTTVQSGLTEQAALLAEQELNITSGLTLNTSTTASDDPFEQARLAAEAQFDAAAPTDADVLTAINSQAAALTTQARAQQSVRALRNNKAQASDWRVRLRLAPNSNYLYKVSPSQVGILAPLAETDGVIFPYTPSIDTAYKANYDAYDLTHSNYRGYFYKGSYVDAVNVRAQFTAQDTKEADYLLAVIHFFRSCTKMFYGQDVQRGSPPPLVYLNGYGDYQFAEHPCVVSQFNYTLPPDVDYIRAQSTLQNNTNQLNSRLRNTIANNPLAYSVNRLLNSGLVSGALDFRPTGVGTGNLATGTPTYVPTKMEISITLLPIQSRAQISNNFSVKEFANGNLLKGGYW